MVESKKAPKTRSLFENRASAPSNKSKKPAAKSQRAAATHCPFERAIQTGTDNKTPNRVKRSGLMLRRTRPLRRGANRMSKTCFRDFFEEAADLLLMAGSSRETG